jgi:hypothetical protein
MRHESAKPQGIHETVTGSAQPDEELTDVRTGPASTADADDVTEADRADRAGALPPDGTREDEVIDPDAVIVEETVVTSSERVPADPPQEPGRDGALTDVTPPPAGTDRAADRAGLTAATAPSATGPAATGAAAATPNASAPVTAPAGGTGGDQARLHDRWTVIQTTFVDDPRASVAAAAELTTEAIETLVSTARERERSLRGEWDRDGADTEDLRNALRGYRGFLDHLATL